jgi:transposase
VACIRCVSTPKAHEVRTFGTTTRELLALADWLGSHGCTHVAMEATGVCWKPVWHPLEADFELVLENAQHIRNVPRRKTDVNDAMWIADLLAHGLIRGSFVPPASLQELRDLTRTRKPLVREIAQHTLRIQKTLEDAHLKLASVLSDILLRLKSRRGPKKAIVAVAASMITAADYILRDRVPYHDLGPRHFDRLHKASASTRLVRRLQDLGCEVQLKHVA